MKKIGIVGFTPATTIEYYRRIVKGFQDLGNPGIYPEMAIDIINVHRVHSLTVEGQHQQVVDYLSKSIDHVSRTGADFIVLASNTPHMYFDELQQRSKVPLLSLVKETHRTVRLTNVQRIGLLGTIFTMEHTFYKTPFLQDGIEVYIPPEEDRHFLQRIINEELAIEIFHPASVERVHHIIQNLKGDHHIEGVILGCTEFPLIVSEESVGLKCFDTLQIHVDRIVDEIMK